MLIGLFYNLRTLVYSFSQIYKAVDNVKAAQEIF